MKKIISMLSFMLMIALVANAQGKKEPKEKTTVFKMEIDCESCVKKIEKNIPFEKGVADLKCDMASQTVAVTYKTSRTDDSKLIAAFKKLGKEAVVVDASQVKAHEHGSSCGHDHKH